MALRASGHSPIDAEIYGLSYNLDGFLTLASVTGMIVLKDAKRACETYHRGNTSETRWRSMSMVKSITSTLA